jgi:hypothetical protein
MLTSMGGEETSLTFTSCPAAETDRITATAARIAAHLGHKTVGVEAARIAVGMHGLAQPPVAEASIGRETPCADIATPP